MTVESGFRRRVAGILRDSGFFVQAIENEVGPGVPDVWYVVEATQRWLELKYIQQMPKKAETSVFRSLNHGLEKEQVNWIELCINKGGKAAVLIGYKNEYFLIPGYMARLVNDFTETELRKFTVTKAAMIEALKSKGF